MARKQDILKVPTLLQAGYSTIHLNNLGGLVIEEGPKVKLIAILKYNDVVKEVLLNQGMLDTMLKLKLDYEKVWLEYLQSIEDQGEYDPNLYKELTLR